MLAFSGALCQRQEVVARLRGLLIAVLLAAFLSCTPPAAPPPPPPPPLPTPPLSEEEIKSNERPHIAITDLNENPSPDRNLVTVSGTLVNRGRGPTREVMVHVEALNRDGAVLQSADAAPTTELIAPGSTAGFSVTLENRADVDRYRVEVVAR